MQNGCYAGQQVIPEGWVDEMTTPSAANENYGMQLWLGTSHEPLRKYDPGIEFMGNLHSEPFVADDVVFLDGAGDQRLYVIPSRELVILRTGKDGPEWDDAVLPNLYTVAVDSFSGQSPDTWPTRADLNAACPGRGCGYPARAIRTASFLARGRLPSGGAGQIMADAQHRASAAAGGFGRHAWARSGTPT